MKRLKDKVAIVTGAAGGMGKAISILFEKEGAKVIATDVQEDKLAKWVMELQKEGVNIIHCNHNVRSRSSWELVVENAISTYGKIDILINNAGIYPVGATTENTTQELWDEVIAVNLTGPFIGSQICLPHLRKSLNAAIVNISSIAGNVGGNGPAYTASKAGLTLLTKDQAIEFAKYKIRVNSIQPGGILTPMTEFLASNPEMKEVIKGLCPMERLGSAEEIANGALFLASNESSYVTGSELVIDGGMISK